LTALYVDLFQFLNFSAYNLSVVKDSQAPEVTTCWSVIRVHPKCFSLINNALNLMRDDISFDHAPPGMLGIEQGKPLSAKRNTLLHRTIRDEEKRVVQWRIAAYTTHLSRSSPVTRVAWDRSV